MSKFTARSSDVVVRKGGRKKKEGVCALSLRKKKVQIGHVEVGKDKEGRRGRKVSP